MSISAISSGSVTAAYTPQPVHQQTTKIPQQVSQSDTVTISRQAQQLASDGDPAALEAQERATERVSESAKGKA
jgi:hypothetical protein